MREDLKPIARDLLAMLHRDCTERKFEFDPEQFGDRMMTAHETIMADFRKKLTIK